MSDSILEDYEMAGFERCPPPEFLREADRVVAAWHLVGTSFYVTVRTAEFEVYGEGFLIDVWANPHYEPATQKAQYACKTEEHLPEFLEDAAETARDG